MILTYEKFLNPFRDKLITQDDFDIVSDLFLEISDDFKEVEYADRYIEPITNSNVMLNNGNEDQFCIFRTFLLKKCKVGELLPYRQIIIGIKIFEHDIPLPIEKEKLRDKLTRFKKRLKKYKFNTNIYDGHEDNYIFLIIINK